MHESKAGDVSQDDNEAADKYEGTTAMMVIDETENLTAYERIQERLKEAPIIQGEISDMSLSFAIRNTQYTLPCINSTCLRFCVAHHTFYIVKPPFQL
jgi:hypothetical protein